MAEVEEDEFQLLLDETASEEERAGQVLVPMVVVAGPSTVVPAPISGPSSDEPSGVSGLMSEVPPTVTDGHSSDTIVTVPATATAIPWTAMAVDPSVTQAQVAQQRSLDQAAERVAKQAYLAAQRVAVPSMSVTEARERARKFTEEASALEQQWKAVRAVRGYSQAMPRPRSTDVEGREAWEADQLWLSSLAPDAIAFRVAAGKEAAREKALEAQRYAQWSKDQRHKEKLQTAQAAREQEARELKAQEQAWLQGPSIRGDQGGGRSATPNPFPGRQPSRSRSAGSRKRSKSGGQKGKAYVGPPPEDSRYFSKPPTGNPYAQMEADYDEWSGPPPAVWQEDEVAYPMDPPGRPYQANPNPNPNSGVRSVPPPPDCPHPSTEAGQAYVQVAAEEASILAENAALQKQISLAKRRKLELAQVAVAKDRATKAREEQAALMAELAALADEPFSEVVTQPVARRAMPPTSSGQDTTPEPRRPLPQQRSLLENLATPQAGGGNLMSISSGLGETYDPMRGLRAKVPAGGWPTPQGHTQLFGRPSDPYEGDQFDPPEAGEAVGAEPGEALQTGMKTLSLLTRRDGDRCPHVYNGNPVEARPYTEQVVAYMIQQVAVDEGSKEVSSMNARQVGQCLMAFQRGIESGKHPRAVAFLANLTRTRPPYWINAKRYSDYQTVARAFQLYMIPATVIEEQVVKIQALKCINFEVLGYSASFTKLWHFIIEAQALYQGHVTRNGIFFVECYLRGLGMPLSGVLLNSGISTLEGLMERASEASTTLASLGALPQAARQHEVHVAQAAPNVGYGYCQVCGAHPSHALRDCPIVIANPCSCGKTGHLRATCSRNGVPPVEQPARGVPRGGPGGGGGPTRGGNGTLSRGGGGSGRGGGFQPGNGGRGGGRGGDRGGFQNTRGGRFHNPRR